MSHPRWPRGQRWKNDAIFFAVRFALKVGLFIPRAWLPTVGAWVGLLAHTIFRQARATTVSNLTRVHRWADPDAVRPLARAVFRTLGQNLTDTLALLDPTEPPYRTLALPESSRRVLAEALGEGRGVVYVTCHLGPWERMAALLAQAGFPITTLARRSYDPRLHRLLYEPLRTNRNINVIYRGDPGAAFSVVRALRRGSVLGFLADLPGRVPTRPAELLGLPSRLPIGPARIALRTGAPVVIGTPARAADATLEVRIERLPSEGLGPGEAGESALTQRMADALTQRIQSLPTHWPWMHPSFSESPPRRANAPATAGT
ncbi:MAG TPA: lysophospholipid acyltransferase family protein [Polyangiaceae bacterium]|nr:lysophospholipid acyltransferase family protein [Polyangiaceae bacterium]